MKTKLSPIKWYRTVEHWNCMDNYCEFVMAVKQPDSRFRPNNPKYIRQRSRFMKHSDRSS